MKEKASVIVLLISLCMFTKSYSQSLHVADKDVYMIKGAVYQENDTLKCHFLEAENDSTFIWKTGFIVRNKGYFDFGKTLVTKEYLPITSGVVSSKVFYADMTPVKTYAIHIILKPKDYE